MSFTAADVQAKKTEITSAGAFFELEEIELGGQSYRAYKHAPKTLNEVLRNGRSQGDIDFMVYEGQRYTYSGFYQAADALAATLQQDYQVVAGERVAIAMRNNPEWVIAYAAITLLGAIVVPVNSWGKTEELRYALEDSGSRILVCDPARFKLIENISADMGIKVLLADGGEASGENVELFADAIGRGRGRDYEEAQPGPQDECVILYTSGSTGFPKGVVHCHAALCQSLMNMMFLGMLVMELEGGMRELRGGAERETPMLTVPLFHATGLLAGFLLPLMTGQKVVMMYKWDSQKALELIQQERITGLQSVPAVLQDLFNRADFDDYDTRSLMRVGAAGAATPAGLPELIAKKVGEPSRSAGWGMTETLAVGSTMSGKLFDLSPDSAGIVSPIVEMRFVDAGNRELAAGEPGEIEVRSCTCTPGYWQKPDANAETFDSQRWMKTGDIGRIDADGFLHITGRIKEIVIRGGENIYPGEIETATYEIPAVQENVVFGVPDAAMGEELAMVIFATPGENLDEAAVRGYLKDRLAAYKIPRYIQFARQPLPQNASGKLHKLKVKEAFIDAL
jgi:long-chain acyl-CoA synthetase